MASVAMTILTATFLCSLCVATVETDTEWHKLQKPGALFPPCKCNAI